MGSHKKKSDTYMLDVIAVGPSTETSNGSGVMIELKDPMHYAGFQRWFTVPESIRQDVLTVGAEAIRGGKRVFTRINYEGQYEDIRKHPGEIEIIQICLKP